ncbi:MAG: response regulator transcription factor [Nitriliruptorales bacterium]|nr:response regulator transcription factor [Nitriliruptorales bacterium]
MSKILVVDDEPSVLAMVRMVLELEGHDVQTVENGSDALEAMERDAPDLLLLDVMMPGLSGFEVAEKMRDIDGCEELPLIFLSAKAERDDIWTGWKLGADSYLTKPFDTDELLEEVSRVLSIRSAPRNEGARRPQVDRLVVLGEATR